MRGPSDFKLTNIKRAFTAAKMAGVVVDRVEVAPDGRIIIVPVKVQDEQVMTDADQIIARLK
jgi:hypothetical protein